jgi:hypothetical protein
MEPEESLTRSRQPDAPARSLRPIRVVAPVLM